MISLIVFYAYYYIIITFFRENLFYELVLESLGLLVKLFKQFSVPVNTAINRNSNMNG